MFDRLHFILQYFLDINIIIICPSQQDLLGLFTTLVNVMIYLGHQRHG